MPYQETSNNTGQNVTPEEYLRLLAIQRRVLQSQGGAASRNVDTTFPSQQQQQQQQQMMQQMQMMPRQRMMQALQGAGFQSQGNTGGRDQMFGNMLQQSMSNETFNNFPPGPGNNRESNLSRSFTGVNSNMNQFIQGPPKNLNNMGLNRSNTMAPSRSFNANRGPLSRSLGFDNGMMASSFPSRMRGMGPRNDGGMNNSNMFPSNHGDSINQRFLSSSPPANLPTNEAITLHRGNAQNNNNTVDLTDDLIQASAGVLSPVIQGKRRRLNSDDLLTDVFGDFAPVAGAAAAGNINDSEGNNDLSNYNDTKASDNNAVTKCLSPFSRRTAACSPLTPLNQTQARGFAETDSPMGQTPIMFAEFFLNEVSKEGDDSSNAMAGIPLPPLYQSEDEPKSGGAGCIQGFGRQQGRGGHVLAFTNPFDPEPSETDQEKLLVTPFSSEPLCLPPRRKKRSTPKTNKKVVTKNNNITKSPKEKLDVMESPSRSNRNTTTPSSAVISLLSAEIRNKMQESPSAGDASECSSPGSADKTTDVSAKGTDGFSIPHFATSMEASQFSQQNIHDWDKKFGLRRAHSKTMRESARSRKNVLEFLKGDGSELLKCALAAGLKQSTTSTTATFPSSMSGASLMSQDEYEEDKDEIEKKAVEAVNKGSEEDKSHASNDDHSSIGIFQIRTKNHCSNDTKMRTQSTSSSTPGLSNDEEEDDDFGSIGSFSHEDGDCQLDDVENEKNSHDLTSSYSSKILEFDIDDEELTSMFRRASLEHPRRSSIDNFIQHHRRSSSIIIPMLDESDRKQCFAKSA